MFNSFHRYYLERWLKSEHNIPSAAVGQIYDWAAAVSPNELAGLLLKDGTIKISKPGTSLHSLVSAEMFVPNSFVPNSEDVLFLWHSHCDSNPARFSTADIQTLRASQYSGIVINPTNDTFDYADKEDRLKFPLDGRNWYYGIHDCYSLVTHYLKRHFSHIELPDISRGRDLEWRSNSFAPFQFLDLPDKWGWHLCLEDPQLGDIFCSNKGRHLSVFTEYGGRCFTHYYDTPCQLILPNKFSFSLGSRLYRYLPE
jgi:proteasome lid subunit RPN8/RPN11